MDSFDLIVIGSGPGGYVAAIRAAQLGMRTAVVEKDPVLGGTCLNVGCIPSKALLHSSELYYQLTHSAAHGIVVEKAHLDFAKMMERKTGVVKRFNQGIEALFKKNRITTYCGIGSFKESSVIEVHGKQGHLLSGKHILIATGSESMTLPFLPIDEKKIMSSTGALDQRAIPKRLLVIGAGVIGVELGSVYKRLGSEVEFIEFLDKICPTLDHAISKNFQTILEKQGLKFHLSAKVVGAHTENGGVRLDVEEGGEKRSFEGDAVLVSIGRRPYTRDLGLEKVGISLDSKGRIPINNRFQTRLPHVYAIGDVVEGPMLAHKASEEGIIAVECMAGLKSAIDYIAIPTVIYTSPEVAAVGLTEQEANQMGFEIETGSFPFKVNSRAQCTGEDEGLVKILSEKKSDRILGIHILGAHASELIACAVLAIQERMTSLEVAEIPYAHPTLSEAIKEAALNLHKRTIHR